MRCDLAPYSRNAPTRDDVLHRQCVSLEAREVAGPLGEIQGVLMFASEA